MTSAHALAAADAVHRWLVSRPEPASSEDGPAVAEIVEHVRRNHPLLTAAEVGQVVGRVRSQVTGLGPLDALLADDAVTDLMVNGPGPVWVERFGRLERTDIVLDRPAIDLLVERIVAPLGRRVDPVTPVVDGRLPDGSRVHVVVPPVAVDGPCITVRRFAARSMELDDVAPPAVAELLRWTVRARANAVVVGGTGSGKTTLLNALAASVPRDERIVTVEDAAELRLPSDHVIRMETRPASVEGTAAVTARELVRNALRMRPDRLIVGEVRDETALEMVQAMNTGHSGSLSTLHANGCNDALRRLDTLVLMAGIGLPLDAVRDHLSMAVDVVIHIARGPDGSRRVVEVAEVVPPGSGPSDGPRTRLLADRSGVVALPVRPPRNEASPPPDPRWGEP